jgi:hypothetical protein
MTVYIIIESKHEDYHGEYREIIDVYGKEEDAKKEMDALNEENYNGNIEYWIDTYKLK